MSEFHDGPPSHRLGASLGAYLRSEGHGDALVLGEISSCWAEVVGDEVAAHASPHGLRADELLVRVDSPGWATHLAFLADEILARLNARLGREVARHVKVTVRGRAGVE